MASRRYEKYFLQPIRLEEFFDRSAASFMTMPPLTFLNGDEPLKGVGQWVEAIWIFSDSPPVAPVQRQTHRHEFDELFIYLGSNQKEMGNLGGEIEWWIGEGETAEKYLINTSSCVFVPRGLAHGPMLFRNVTRPFLYLTVGFNVGEKYNKTRSVKK